MEDKVNNQPEKKADVREKSSALWNKAKESFVKVADRNDDGTFDIKDVTVVAGAIGNAAKTAVNTVVLTAEERSREMERKQLQPFFAEDIDSADFVLPKLIRVTDMDKKHAESEVCKGSVGYITTREDLRIVNIYKDKTELFGLDFYPDEDSELYYVDPSDRNRYIALDDYFVYLKHARVNELQKIAQDLGAKYFRVTYKEQKTTFTNHKAKAGLKGKSGKDSVTLEAEQGHELTDATNVEVAAEMHCIGHEPHEPKLCYLQRESSIQTLVALRMDKNSKLTQQKYMLKLSNSSGIKEKDAIKVDAALKGMKLSGNTTLSNEVRNEARRFFEYEIEF